MRRVAALVFAAAAVACAAPAPAFAAGTLWNPPGIASPERPDEIAPWPPSAAAEREAWVEIAMLEDTRATDLARLLGHLQSGPELVRWRVCRAFARLQDSTGVEQLTEVLGRDPSLRVRAEAAFALGQIGSRRAVTSLRFATRDQTDPIVRGRAIEALGKIGDPAGVGPVAGFLTAPEPELSREAAIALWRLNDSTAVLPLLEGVKSKDDWTRAYSAYALERTSDPARVVPALQKLLNDPAIHVRAYAARALGRQRAPTAIGPLLEAWADRDPRVRTVAVRSLGTLADSAALPQVLSALRDPDPNVRETAATAAGALRSRDAAPALKNALKDGDGGVRLAAARALAALLGPQAVADLRPLVKDRVSWVRAGALDALGAAGGDEARKLVLEAARKAKTREERSSAYGAWAALRAGDEKGVIRDGLKSTDWLVAASAAGAAGASGDSTLVPDLVRLYRNNPDPKEPDVALSVLDAFATLGPGALKAGAASAQNVRDVLGHAAVTRDARQRAEALRAARAVFADSSALAIFEGHHPAPEWRAEALATYRARLAEEDSTGTIGRLVGAKLQTSKGTIEWRFDPREAPRTVLNFATLARRAYYDGGTWHRVVPYFVAQDGDPSATGSGGPGYAFRCEYNRLRYDTGAVGMALSGKDTGGSQYFITHCPQPHLDGRYTIFAHVVSGQDVVDRLRRGDRIEKVTLIER